MTLNAEDEPTELARPAPHPPTSFPVPFARGSHPHSVGKRFTVRDGFHLKIRNAEAQAAIDTQLTVCEDPLDPFILPQNEDELPPGPSKHEITAASPSPATKRQNAINNNNLEDRPDNETTNIAVTVLHQLLLQPEHSNQYFNSREGTSGKVRAALRAPAEWLIHRRRPSETKQRKQQKVNKLLREILQEPEKRMDAKQDEVRAPRRPRCQSTLGSTYNQRVAAARPKKLLSSEHEHNYHRELLQPLTETERGLLRSREDNSKAVDKLLVSLFHPPPSVSATPATTTTSSTVTSFVPIVKPTTPTNRFSTRRSVMRHETAMALRSRNLVSRMNELRSLPQLLQQMEALQLWKRQQQIVEHGVDIVARNRANPTLQVLQKSSQTPLLPSATDHKVHQANKRKQQLDAAKEENMRRLVVRWQIRREHRAQQARRVHVQSQWLLVVALAESSKKWLTKFHDFRQKRNVLERIIMAKRLQQNWRQRTLVQRNSLHFAPRTPLSSVFFRLPVVIHAVSKLQQGIRDWLKQKHDRERKDAVALIVTAWFEFQDVKFRRIILRFRKRVRDFQVMWRAWRAITAARIKLLLLVWAKLERKVKRRHGVIVSHASATFSPPSDHPHQLKGSKSGDEAGLGLPVGKGLTLLDMLQRTTAERPLSQQHKQLEDMHRHFRNGGAVHTPISAVSSGSLGPHSSTSPNPSSLGGRASSPSSSSRKTNQVQPTDNAHVRQDLQLRNNMEEEFQLVMYDVYTTRQNLSPKAPARSMLGAAHVKHSPTSPHKSSPCGSHIQPSSLHLPSASSNVPVPPPSKKVPHHLKVTALRKLLSEKRKLYSDARDRGREAWAAARKQMRTEAFRYDVLDELAAFQQLQAKYATFLLLHSITEADMVRLIHQTQEDVNAAESVTTIHLSQTPRKSFQGVGHKSLHNHIDTY